MKMGVSLLLALFVASLLASCSSDDRDVVFVMAASSLTDGFGEIEQAFEAVNPDIDVQFSYAGSSALREQILSGAPADVFASANHVTMQALVDTGASARGRNFVRNDLVLAVPAGNPGQVTGLADLADSDLLVGLCGAQVPCGQFARQALQQAGVEASIDTDEASVRALLIKIEAGELDVGIVYSSDISASRQIEAIDLPPAVDVDITYPIAVLTEAPEPAGAELFVNFVLSAEGQSILAANGFGAP